MAAELDRKAVTRAFNALATTTREGLMLKEKRLLLVLVIKAILFYPFLREQRMVFIANLSVLRLFKGCLSFVKCLLRENSRFLLQATHLSL